MVTPKLLFFVNEKAKNTLEMIWRKKWEKRRAWLFCLLSVWSLIESFRIGNVLSFDFGFVEFNQIRLFFLWDTLLDLQNDKKFQIRI